MLLTQAFRAYGATLKNINWSVSAENDAGELIVSLWKHYFGRPNGKTIRYSDRITRWRGPGNKEFKEHLDKAFMTGQTVRPVIARAYDEKAVLEGKDASKLKKSFDTKEDWFGRVISWDGDYFVIEFTQIPGKA